VLAVQPDHQQHAQHVVLVLRRTQQSNTKHTAVKVLSTQ
jgi:hypothetical protein